MPINGMMPSRTNQPLRPMSCKRRTDTASDGIIVARVKMTFTGPMSTGPRMAKLFATEAALENSLEAMRIHGAYGYSKEFNIERYYRDAPLLAIGEGTNELQRIIIARELVKRNPA